MTNVRLKIPRAAIAILVLGGGCGDESKPREDTDSDDAGADAESETAADGGAAAPAEDGALASAPDTAQTPAATDTTDARLLGIARDFCEVAFECDSEQAETVFGSEIACREQVEDFWRDDIELGGEECGDAQLDLYACYASASCEEQFSACLTQAELSAERCPDTAQGSGLRDASLADRPIALE